MGIPRFMPLSTTLALSKFNENSGLAALSLIPIETEEEWELVEQILQDAAE